MPEAPEVSRSDAVAGDRSSEHRVATSALSTAESVVGDVDEVVIRRATGRGVPGLLRKGWRQLTTMRTALLLLFLLALAAIPGSLFPQRGVNTPRVDVYYRDHPGAAPILDRLGLFDVFGSTWFYTLYALLAVSLVGCLIPRLKLHAKSSIARPPAPPRHFDRLPSSSQFFSDATAADVIDAAHRLLRSRRWRTDRRTAADGSSAVAAEKGYLRETGNLVFHVSLLVLLAAVAVGALLGYTGIFAVVEGQRSFTNTVTAYDTYSLGRWVDPSSFSPFTVRLDDFRASYLPNNQPSDFHADVTWSRTVGGTPRRQDIRVNHPLGVGGAKVYLLGSGFAPRFVVRAKDGTVVSDEYVRFLPQQNANQYSTGVLKVPNGLPYDVGLRAAFVPTVAFSPQGPYSSSPEAKAPVLFYQLFTGDLRLTRAQSVFDFDETGMTPGAEGVLLPGQRIELPGGGSITWDGFRDYAVFQTTRNPGTRTAFWACVLGLLGMIASLFVRRRRIWVRAAPSAGGTVVTVGGLARHDAERFRIEFAALTEELSGRVAGRDIEPAAPQQPAATEQPHEHRPSVEES